MKPGTLLLIFVIIFGVIVMSGCKTYQQQREENLLWRTVVN